MQEIIIRDEDGFTVPYATFWFSLNEDGTDRIVNDFTTDAAGHKFVPLDPATLWVWARAEGVTFNNPTQVTIP